MRIVSITRISLLAIMALTIFSCDEKEELVTDKVSDYMLLTPGKYIVYRLDSLIFTDFGRVIETHRYQVKDQVDALIVDDLGRPSYRIYRSIRDSLGTQPWQPSATFLATPLTDQVEWIEDNFRFIKMHMPMKDGFSWRGNKYLPNEPYDPEYTFSNDISIQDWDYYYDGGSSSFSHRGNNYDNVYTVEQIDETFNVPITSPTSYASKSRGVEKYAKGIGLVYKEYTLWDYQPNTGGPGGPYYTGFGVTMWMIGHN
jgi:hypothetical protein